MRYSDDPIWQKYMAGRSLVLLVWLALAILNGCMVGPDFQRPHTTLPADWSEPAVEPRPVTSAETDLARWWTLFDDPRDPVERLDVIDQRRAVEDADLGDVRWPVPG